MGRTLRYVDIAAREAVAVCQAGVHVDAVLGACSDGQLCYARDRGLAYGVQDVAQRAELAFDPVLFGH